MIGVRVARLSAALALIVGLLGMHGLVVIDSDHMGDPTPQSSSAMTMHPPPPTATHGEATTPVAPPGASHHGTPVPAHDGIPHPGAHQMLHLCLAVLAALLTLIACVGLMWSLDRPGIIASLAALRNGRREPPLRPPPTSVRLAQLSVMRN